MSKKKIEDVDLYGLLEIEITATEAEIKKAYRKKALQCHPDKNPDDASAAETFHELSRALEVLSDAAARAAYDKVLRAKTAAKLRHRELDSKRLKMKEDLEHREREASAGHNSRTDEQKLADEIKRLQAEGSRLLKEENQRMKEELRRRAQGLMNPVWESSLNRIKIKWAAAKTDSANGGYSEELLKRFLNKYGDIVALIVSPKKKGSALVEFATKEASEMAIDFEKGLPENPLTLKWINEKPVASLRQPGRTAASLVSERDYESLVLTKMRQAAERQKLIEEMMKEDQ